MVAGLNSTEFNQMGERGRVVRGLGAKDSPVVAGLNSTEFNQMGERGTGLGGWGGTTPVR